MVSALNIYTLEFHKQVLACKCKCIKTHVPTLKHTSGPQAWSRHCESSLAGLTWLRTHLVPSMHSLGPVVVS